MKLSKRGEQALKSLMELASAYPCKPLTLKHLSEMTGTSIKFLEQILLLLRRGRFVISIRGNRGGFVLARPPQEVYLGDVVRFVDGPLSPLGTKEDLEELLTTSERYYGLFKTLLDVRNSASGILDHCSLWDVCQMSRGNLSRMYYI